MSNVMDMSEEEFDQKFEEMMSTPPEDFDAGQADQGEENLAEQPEAVEEEPTPQEEEQEIPEEELGTEQPEEQLDSEDIDTPAAEEDTGNEEEEDSVETDSDEPEEFNFDSIPRDKVIPRDIKVNGMNVRATMQELEEGFKMGMNYTQKMQEIAPHRKNMNIMMENDLTTDDLNLLIEAKSGNKNALGKLLADAKIDPLDLETEEDRVDPDSYTPKDYSKDVPNYEMEQLKAAIVRDSENAPVVQNALQTMPEDMYEFVSKETRAMSSLYDDVKSGLYQKVMPEVIKQQSLYGVQEPTLQTYLKVAEQYFQADGGSEQPQAEPEQPAPAPKATNKELNNKRKSAAPTPRGTKTGKKSYIQKDLDNMDDDEFEKHFQEMVGRSTNDFR